jgi:hypothetical protein
VVLGLIFARSRNLLPSMLLHSLWNGFVFMELMRWWLSFVGVLFLILLVIDSKYDVSFYFFIINGQFNCTKIKPKKVKKKF